MPDLQTLIAMIPTAQPGSIITIDYHNALKDAITSMASQLGGTGLPRTVTVTFAPDLTPNDGSPAWSRQSGVASKPGGGATSAIGWMGLQLPDGYRIERIAVTGTKTGNVGSWSAALIRQSLTATGQLTVVSATLEDATTDAANSFQVSQQATTTSNLIDNSQFKYVLIVRLIGADAAATASILGFQVVCNRT